MDSGFASRATFGLRKLERTFFNTRSFALLAGAALLLLAAHSAYAQPATLNSLAISRGTVLSGNLASLAADDDVALSVSAAPPAGKKGPKKYLVEWTVSATVPEDTIAIRITFNGSASARVKQKLWFYRWRNGKWKTVQNAQVAPSGTTRTCIVDSAFQYVSSTGEVRLRLEAENKKPFTHSCDQILLEVLPAGTKSSLSKAGLAPGADLGVRWIGRTVHFALPAGTQTNVLLFDIRGRRVASLESSRVEGSNRIFVWDGRDGSSRPVARGMYFAYALVPSGSVTRRFVWLRE